MGVARWVLACAALLSGSAATAAGKLMSVDGTVEDVQADKVTIQGARGTPQVLSLDSNSRFVERKAVSEADLKKGDQIQALVMPQPSGSAKVLAIAKMSAEGATATSGMAPENWTGGSGSAIPSGTGSQVSTPKPKRVAGTVEKVEGSTITVRGVTNRQMDFSVSEETKYLAGRTVEANDLKQGDHVRAFVRPQSGGTMSVVAIGIAPPMEEVGVEKPGEGSVGSGSALPSGGAGGDKSAADPGTGEIKERPEDWTGGSGSAIPNEPKPK